MAVINEVKHPSREEVIQLIRSGQLHLHENFQPLPHWKIVPDSHLVVNTVRRICEDKERCIDLRINR